MNSLKEYITQSQRMTEGYACAAFTQAGLDIHEFEPVKNNPLYYISKDDRVFSILKGRLLKLNKNGGYLQVFLSNKWHYMHRLKMYQWSEVPENHAELWINHEDGDKSNNALSNLKWGTISYNIQHAHDTGLVKKVTGPAHWRYGKKASAETRKIQSQLKMGAKHPKFVGYFITPLGRFESANQAGIAEGISGKVILNRCKSWRWHSRGYSFEYPDGRTIPAVKTKSWQELFA